MRGPDFQEWSVWIVEENGFLDEEKDEEN